MRSLAECLELGWEVVVTGGRRLAWFHRDGTRHLPLTRIGPRSGRVLRGARLPLTALLLDHDVWVESFTPPVSSNLVPLVTRRPVIGLAHALSGRDMRQRYRTRLRPVPGTHRHRAEGPRPPAGGLPRRGGARRTPAPGHRRGGRAQDEKRLEELVAQAGAKVRWVGVVRGQAKEDLIVGSSLLVVPSREESFCLSALEGLARGRPVVHFDLPQLDWIPASASTAVPSFDVAALRKALVWWTSQPGERSAAGARATAFASARFGTEHLDRYRVLVAETLERAGGRRARRGKRSPSAADER